MSILSSYGQQTEKRIALVAGNAAYKTGLKLRNPVNDANMIADSLYALGFDTVKVLDATKERFEKTLQSFVKKIPDYNTVLFYYAGHGIQSDGINYLIPVDAELQDIEDVRYQGTRVNFVVDELERYSKTTIVILDACRNNPFRTWMRGANAGFAAMNEQSPGTIIAYATRELSTASDGITNNGLYTESLVKQMMKPQSINDMFTHTRFEVLEKSKYRQCPQEWNMLTKPFYFIPPSKESIPEQRKDHKLVPDIYHLYYADTSIFGICQVTEFEIYDVTDSTFQIRGVGQPWGGSGVLHKDNTGRYDWKFRDGSYGSTYIRINKNGSIRGRVSGENIELDWIYVAYPVN